MENEIEIKVNQKQINEIKEFTRIVQSHHELQSLMTELRGRYVGCKALPYDGKFSRKYNVDLGSISSCVMGYINELESKIKTLESK